MPINTDNPATMANDTLTSVVNGIVGTEDAAKLFQMLGIQQQITETSELRKEISELKEMIFNVGNR
jgi:vacuolar-type H+-ATPase subunit F/Vma7